MPPTSNCSMTRQYPVFSPGSQRLCWLPDLPHISQQQRKTAWHNALRLAQGVDTVILDHHLMRSMDGCHWLYARRILWRVVERCSRHGDRVCMRRCRCQKDGTKPMLVVRWIPYPTGIGCRGENIEKSLRSGYSSGIIYIVLILTLTNQT